MRRYGHLVPSIQDAWDVLYHTIYNCTDGAYVSMQKTVMSIQPFLLFWYFYDLCFQSSRCLFSFPAHAKSVNFVQTCY